MTKPRPNGERKPEVAVITGASAGVGRAVARALARRGARIGLIARGFEGLAATAREVESLGGQALMLPADVADADQVELAAQRIESELGPIDVWINNAMVSVFSPVAKMTPGDFQRVTDVTYLGAVHGTLSALRRMLPRDRGVVIQVGSALAYRSIPLQAAYCAAKHAMVGFTDSLRSELHHDRSRVRVTVVNLPAMNTPQFGWAKNRMSRRAQPIPPVYAPEVAARAIVWAIDHPRREIEVGLSTLFALMAQRIVPGLADRYLARHYESQQTPAAEDPRRPNNLWAPVRGDRGVMGTVPAPMRRRSPQLWLTMNRALLAAVAAGVLIGATGIFGALRPRG